MPLYGEYWVMLSGASDGYTLSRFPVERLTEVLQPYGKSVGLRGTLVAGPTGRGTIRYRPAFRMGQ